MFFYCCCATINMVNKDLQIYIAHTALSLAQPGFSGIINAYIYRKPSGDRHRIHK